MSLLLKQTQILIVATTQNAIILNYRSEQEEVPLLLLLTFEGSIVFISCITKSSNYIDMENL
jgi:hypothetical protein